MDIKKGGLFENVKTLLSLTVPSSSLTKVPLKDSVTTLTSEQNDVLQKLLDLNRVMNELDEVTNGKSSEYLHNFISKIPISEREENAKIFVKLGFLPPINGVESDDTSSGGGPDDEKPIKTPVPPVRKSPRSGILSPQAIVNLTKQLEDQEEEARERERVKAREEAAKVSAEAQRKSEEDFKKEGRFTERFEALENEFKRIALNVCNEDRLTNTVTALFPSRAIELWRVKHTPRYLYEHGSTPDTQCNNVIGKDNEKIGTLNKGTVEEVVVRPNECYLCGQDFDDSDNDLKRSCDHVLPIIQAVFFLDLYRTSDKGVGSKRARDETILEMEYAWTHLKCNVLKNDISFLKTIPSAPSWEFSDEGATKILEQIYYKNESIRGKLGKFDVWKSKRINIIKKFKMNKIVEYINGKGNGGAVLMMGLRNCINPAILHTDFNKILTDLKGSTGGKRKTRRKLNKKRTTYRKRRKS
jgi:hypothetical protein